MTDSTTPSAHGRLTFLRVGAALAALGSLISPLLALGWFSGGFIHAMHGMVGNLNVVLAVVAAVGAVVWARTSGNKGLMGHGISVPVLAVVQVAIGQMHLDVLHVVLGFVYLLAAVSLATLALRKPHGA